jgi:uridine kinase
MQRSSPRHLSIHVRTDGEDRVMPTGVHPSDVLPCEVDGKVVVAALIDNAIYPLDTPIPTDVTLRPLTTAHWEGQRIYRRSAGLLLLEAACELAPGCTVSLASSVSGYQWIDVFPASGETIDLPSLAARLEAKMREYVERDVSFRHEWWVVAEAARYFEERGWGATARLLDISRDPTVRMVSCGKMYVLGSDALISHAGCIRDFAVRPVDHRLVLIADGTEDESAAAAHLAYAEVMRQHDLWLRSLGIHGVGDFNARCVNGEVSETILVGEGFHEKRITMVADEIAARPGIRIVCIAGPSSSGKTTFIKRLRVQLQVHGLDPVPLSLDDYYADREKCPRDASGEFDFEALEALDLDLLAGQLRRLLAGETVRVAHFDFATGTSRPEGGRELHLGENTILMLEGIHGLNPGLLGDAVAPDKVFRVFIQPLASLAFDRLSRVNPSDLRLIRRIVRDRHTRDCSAAQNIARWPSVRRGEHAHIFPFVARADAVFDSSLTYELSVLKVYAERYLLEVPRSDPGFGTALRLRQLIDRFVAIYPDHVPPTSILREFIGSSSFEY